MIANYNKTIRMLLIYVIVMVIIIFFVGIINRYFYDNLKEFNEDTEIKSNCSMLNLYFLRVVRLDGIRVKKYGLVDEDKPLDYYITFENNEGKTYTFIKNGSMVYMNSIKLCEDVDSFIILLDKSTKESISVEITIKEQKYELQYAID